jgi:AcrR family transcriptional regulator
MNEKTLSKKRKNTPRLPKETRKALVLNKAYEFFSEQGPSAKTRALAEYCGVSQRLLYSLFPNKAALLSAVYESEISGPIKGIWFEQLRDRDVDVEVRLINFYKDYYESILTRKWLRFFLFASLQDISVAPKFISDFVTQLVKTIVEEVAFEKKLKLPINQESFIQELGWVLHGSISHLAIRRQIYKDRRSAQINELIEAQVKMFVRGLPAIFEPKK